MTTVLLFGAGASFGSKDCRDTGPPPLGTALFDALARRGGAVGDIARRLAVRSHELGNAFGPDPEAAMLELYQSRPKDVPPLHREMAIYFAGFRPGPDNLYRKIADWTTRSAEKVIIATTNYECLIELSFATLGWGFDYTGAGGPPPQHVVLLKIHGSCHFLIDANIQHHDFGPNPDDMLVVAPVRIAESPDEVIRWCRAQTTLAPAIACYMRGKRLPFFVQVVPEAQIAYAREVERADRIIIVGLRYNPADTHIWEPLARSVGTLGYVGRPDGSAQAFQKWANENGRTSARVLAPTFGDALEHLRAALVG